MRKITLALALLLLGNTLKLSANEGMWLPMFVQRLNYADMQKVGLKLTAEEIYSVNHSSLKDAIVMLSGGSCTAEVISKEGLLLTNHHCAFGSIQENSTVEHDYLTDGFWAMDKSQELRTKQTASFLVRMEDVTDKVNEALAEAKTEDDRDAIIAKMSKEIVGEATAETHYDAKVKSFFGGNEFYLFVYETFTDVRLVGAPPSAIGKFGGDTDNWMWPRQTGDFSMLRVYMAPDGTPAEYSEENIPYVPKHHLPISMSGVNEDDFAMIMGYPGSTDRYLTSYGVEMAINIDQPARVKIRGKKLELYKEDMDASDEVRIKYASKYARVSNYWKYFIGQTEQLKKNHIYEKKKAEEEAFQAWADGTDNQNYVMALESIKEAYVIKSKYQLARTYLGEAIFGSELLSFSYGMSPLTTVLANDTMPEEQLQKIMASIKPEIEAHFKDYNQPTDVKVTEAMLRMYDEDLAEDLKSPWFNKMAAKYKGDYAKWSADLFKNSIFATEESSMEFIENPSLKALSKDPSIQLITDILNYYRGFVSEQTKEANDMLEKGNRDFIAGLRVMNPDKIYAPNANSTMRLTYGQVLPYDPRDAVHYNYFTTLKGVMEKEDPSNPEFVVPEKLNVLYEEKDYGQYADKDGTLHVCFLTNNDITGGNSGSPVINANGELIGTAFDGNWEAMSGDIFFETEIQRTIVCDIRYVLFIVDKYAGATNLIEEMTLVFDPVVPAAPEVPMVPAESVEPASLTPAQ